MTIPARRTPRQSYAERVETEHGVDEFGPTHSLYVEFTCYWSIVPGERQTFDSPSCSAEAELLEVHVLKAEGKYSEITRNSGYGLTFLDSMEEELRQLVEDDKDGTYHQSAFEAVADSAYE